MNEESIQHAIYNMKNEEKKYYFPILPPILPHGVVPDGEDAPIAQDSTSYSYANVFHDGNGFPGYPYLAQLSTRAEYRAFASTLSTELTREWIRFTSTEDGGEITSKQIILLEKEIERIGLRNAIRTAAEHDSLFGRGQIFIEIKGDDRDAPLILDSRTIKKGSLARVQAIEPMWTTPNVYNAIDPSAPDFYKPTKWFMLGQRVHASRLLTIITRELPDMLKPAFNFSGISLSQLAEPYVENWLRTRQAIADLVNNFSIISLSTDMSQVLFGNEEETGKSLWARAELFAKTRSNRGLFLFDKERESLEQIAVPLSGLHELQAQAQEHMCAVSRMPAMILTGISPSGLNASSDGEIRAWYDWISATQEAFYRHSIEIVVNIAQLSLFGYINPAISFEFCPLRQIDEKDKAQIRLSDAQCASLYIDRGVLDTTEERGRIARDKEGIFNGIDSDLIINKPQETLQNENSSLNSL